MRAVVGFLALAVAGLTSQDAQMVRAAYFATELTASFVIVPLSLALLPLTGGFCLPFFLSVPGLLWPGQNTRRSCRWPAGIGLPCGGIEMGTGMGVGVYGLLALAITAVVFAAVWAERRRLGCMAAMMAAMAVGMVAGLWVGVAVGATADLWRATLIGGGFGLAVGLGTGAAVGLMPALDGSLSGLMGGMMGAMLGAMAPHPGSEMLPVATGLVMVNAAFVLAIIAGEVGWDRLSADVTGAFRSRGGGVALLVVLAVGAIWLGATRPR